MTLALVVGAGPAGLMAADQLAKAGLEVIVAEAKPSIGRKFLMAGKSGLNLTKAEPADHFLAAYGAAAGAMAPMIDSFGPDRVRSWAESLGQEVFTGSSGRVFPRSMKASPLLRSWAARLEGLGVTLRRRWRWLGWNGAAMRFDTPDGPQELTPAVTVLALGGASWARLGSDGAWAPVLAAEDVPIAPFLPANIGLRVSWTPPMTRHFGIPVKNIALTARGQRVRGEVVISRRGLEGGGIYALSAALRDGAPLMLDLLPDMRQELVVRRLSHPQGKSSLSNYLRKSLRLPPVKVALLREFARPMPEDAEGRAEKVKSLLVRHHGPRPMDEAISTAGGIRWEALDENLMLRARPGTFAAGEMLDWEAPTGGYLLTGCLATGRWAGRAAARWANGSSG